MDRTRELQQGILETVPLIFGIMPFGITFGVMGLTAGLTPAEVMLMSVLVFAGAAQFVAVSMIAAGIHAWVMIVLTTLLINLRHLLMGASLAPYLTRLPAGAQAFLAFHMADETYMVTVNRAERAGYSPWFQLGTNLTGYATWLISTMLGLELGKYIGDPLRWGLDFAMPATFLAMLVPRLQDRTGIIVSAVAAFTAIGGAVYLPGKWYILLATLAACLTGIWLERGEVYED
ncbi:branched-chain amino acid transport permease [Lucifera butyrica]|uniref:Branched-chain amino acid transport permease n=1 Tax=Lucifera butyrica TaxID=1351585 RepID=A0A498RC37_9FIRM|nr:AzlC family ABC transporter permease [Lucifera butyrica]VBB07812.1 branched-chain amino acid transport permease [Lucifera butyrica]